MGGEFSRGSGNHGAARNRGSSGRNAVVYQGPRGFKPSRALRNCLENIFKDTGGRGVRDGRVNETVNTTNDEQYQVRNTDKKSQADNEYDWFKNCVLGGRTINGWESDISPTTFREMLGAIEHEFTKKSSSNGGTGDRGSGGRNATVYTGPSGFRPSRALLSCLRNCGQTSERTDGVNETVDTTNDEQYQLRETSDRELLADALTSVAKTPEELDLLKSYKSNSARIDKLNAELSDVNSQIKEISFSKGKRDTTTLANLRARKTKLEADISRFDKRLLQLEASKPIKDILTREKTAAVKKAKAEMREISKEKVEQLNQKISDIKQHNREMNARKVESRRKTELKNKILN